MGIQGRPFIHPSLIQGIIIHLFHFKAASIGLLQRPAEAYFAEVDAEAEGSSRSFSAD